MSVSRVSVRIVMDNITPTSATGGGTDPLNAFAELARIVVDA